jgi:hypothetical protein
LVTGACVTLALIHGRIALGGGPRAPSYFFVLNALAVATISLMELGLQLAPDVATCNAILRWSSIPVSMMVTASAGFIWTLFGTGRIWLGVTGAAVAAMAEVANLVSRVPAVRHAVDLRRIDSFWGSFSAPVIHGGPWAWVEMTGTFLVVLFVLDASVALAKLGGGRRAFAVGGGVILFFVISRGHALLIESGAIHSPNGVQVSPLQTGVNAMQSTQGGFPGSRPPEVV